MGARRTGREAALKMLFQMEASGEDAERTVTLFWRSFGEDAEGREYADVALRGIAETLVSVDEQITKASAHWRLERMTRVDRNVLRLGAWELPIVAKRLAEVSKKGAKFDAIIALGAVIRGSTPHFDYVAGEAAKGIAGVAMSTGVPIAFGVLTTDTIEQAIERAGTKAGNKGWDAATSAIELVSLGRALGAAGL